MRHPGVPELPEVPAEQVGVRELAVRYEDITQDGRLRIEGVWAAMGRILWTELDVAQVLMRLAQNGIRNVLARIVIDCEDESITARVPARSEVRYELGHTTDAEGSPNRRLMLTYLRTDAWRGSPRDPLAVPGAERVLAARAYGVHVFTRPTARAGAHRVLELGDPALDTSLGRRLELPPAEQLLELPPGAGWLDPRPRPELVPTVLGLAHTDGNQHINFQAYPRFVEDAALRRLDELGFAGPWLGRRAEVAYQKPCFAGERLRIVTRAFELGETLGVVAAFVEDSGGGQDWASWGRPRCLLRMLLSR